MPRGKKKRPIFLDAPLQMGLTQAAELAGLPRTVAWRALRTRDAEHPLGIFAAHYVPCLKKPYFTHPNSLAEAAKGAWETYVHEVRMKNLKTDPSSGSSSYVANSLLTGGPSQAATGRQKPSD